MRTEAQTPETGAPDGRATRWEGHRAERRDLIIESAIEAISERGGDVAVGEIAERAAIPRSVIYRIFKDREDLDENIRARIVEDLMTELAPALAPQGTVRDAIDKAVETYLRWIITFPRLHRFLGTGSTSRPTTGSRVVTGTKTAIAVQVTELIAAALRASDSDPAIAETLAFGMVGLVDGSVNRWVSAEEKSVSSETLGAFLADAIWHLLRATAESGGVSIQPDTLLSELL